MREMRQARSYIREYSCRCIIGLQRLLGHLPGHRESREALRPLPCAPLLAASPAFREVPLRARLDRQTPDVPRFPGPGVRC
eukprot:1083745-Pyramimonas_sp.AAC.1